MIIDILMGVETGIFYIRFDEMRNIFLRTSYSIQVIQFQKNIVHDTSTGKVKLKKIHKLIR